jgi:hypothetical protein
MSGTPLYLLGAAIIGGIIGHYGVPLTYDDPWQFFLGGLGLWIWGGFLDALLLRPRHRSSPDGLS